MAILSILQYCNIYRYTCTSVVARISWLFNIDSLDDEGAFGGVEDNKNKINERETMEVLRWMTQGWDGLPWSCCLLSMVVHDDAPLPARILHARIAMDCWIGMVNPSFYKFPCWEPDCGRVQTGTRGYVVPS